MSVGNSNNPAKDENLIKNARGATETPSATHTHNHTAQTKTTENDGLVKLSKVHPQAAAGLKSACAMSPAFAEALNSDDDYKDLILRALDKNPKLFSSPENIEKIVKSFDETVKGYSKYNSEMDKLGKEDMAKAMKMHLNAVMGEYGSKARMESIATLALEYGAGSMGKIGGILKLASAMGLFKVKDVANYVGGGADQKHSALLDSLSSNSTENANDANTQNLAMQQANQGR